MLDLPGLDSMIEQRYISVRKHPSVDLFIYNYTAKAQFERRWTNATTACRGLILDADRKLVQRPFRKFFNLGEKFPIEGEFEVWKKYDGSLGVLYWVDERPAIASRGSFTSDQALKATAILEDRYRDSWELLDRDKTYLFEIIYPDNRIVVDYGDTEELRLLTIVDTATGEESLPDASLGFPVAEQLAPDDVWELKKRNHNNEEGYVLFWRERGYRLKVKFGDYLAMHKVLTGLTAKGVWELLRAGNTDSLADAREHGTPQFAEWLDGLTSGMKEAFDGILLAAENDIRLVPKDADRRVQAELITHMEHPHLRFMLLDGRDPTDAIWQMVKPGRGFETFRKDGE